MDDKEKEKFGVIIDKNDQDAENQPKVDFLIQGHLKHHSKFFYRLLDHSY